MSDLRREYVVEMLMVAEPKDGTAKPQSQWWSIHRTDDQQEAIAVAKEEKAKQPRFEYRVRQFWVESVATQATPLADKPTAPTTVSMDTVACPNHPHRIMRVYQGSTAPRCPDCRKAMISSTLVADMDNITLVDLTEGTIK